MSHFLITGGNKLKGSIAIPGAKNATLPMFCAALLTTEKCVFHNVPNIQDIETLLEIFKEIGVTVSRDFENKIVEIQAKKIDVSKLEHCKKVKKLRATLLLIGPLLARIGKIKIEQPGGCFIGARPNYIHTDGLKTLGATIRSENEYLHLEFKQDKLKNKNILLSEASVTGTENLAIFLSGIEDESELYFTAAEPHVCSTLRMLKAMGAKITGIGTHQLKIKGSKKLKGGTFNIPPDGILVGTYAIAGILTKSRLTINNVNHAELLSFYGLLKRAGANFKMQKNTLEIFPTEKLNAIPKVHTAIFPGFSTDLQSPIGVLLTQCNGTSQIFETLFENRLTYLNELEKMGANIKILNSHQAQITGPAQLKGAEVTSWDLRAGAAMVLAGLIAKGETIVTNVQYIDRGYENFVENLKNLGADISRVIPAKAGIQ